MINQLNYYVKECAKSFDHWEREHKDGCCDPHFSDGVNLNLVRNHIIYYKSLIKQSCQKNNLTLPPIYYRDLPPVLPHDFFAHGKNFNQQRVNRIKDFDDRLKRAAQPRPVQLSLF